MQNRRQVLAGLAAVAAVAATKTALASAPFWAEREDAFYREYSAIAEAYVDDLGKEGGVRHWIVSYSNRAPPKRLRLARLYVELRELTDPTALEEMLRETVECLWLDVFSLRVDAERAARAASQAAWSKWESEFREGPTRSERKAGRPHHLARSSGSLPVP